VPALFFEGGTGWDVEVNGESSKHKSFMTERRLRT
jgi:hypothetical protein